MSAFERAKATSWIKAMLGALLAITLLIAPTSAQASVDDETESVIVQTDGTSDAPKDLTKQLGGSIVYDLPIINGFAATLPKSQISRLSTSPGVRFVTEDAPVHLNGLLGDVLDLTSSTVDSTVGTLDSTVDTVLSPTDVTAVAPTAELTADLTTAKTVDEVVDAPLASGDSAPAVETPSDHPVGTLVTDPDFGSVHRQVIGATTANQNGVTGKGTTVALLDTGVADLPDLAGTVVPVTAPDGTVKKCVNLSGESGCGDSYGHGTFLAGLIAGNGASSNGKFKGVAPDTKILSLKMAGRDGSASVGKIIFGIQWVAAHQKQYGIDVLNLSLGTDSTQSYRYDPLNFAVERAWNSGVTVVVSAGNRGPDARTISKPADDPLVITVGAVDDQQTKTRGDDLLPDFSSKGPTASDNLTKPDITAPGARLVSLRSPGSAIETQFPGGGVDNVYRRGSGTSQSAAVVSGSVALLLQAHPELTPNQVKYALTHSTKSTVSTDPNSVGAGLIDIGTAVASPPEGEANQGVVLGVGSGSLKASQGSVRLLVKDGGRALGLLDNVVPIKNIDRAAPSGGGWYGTGWAGGGWYGGGWYGGGWYGGGWYGGGWYGGGWYGGGWYGGGWYGGSWYGGSWYGAWD